MIKLLFHSFLFMNTSFSSCCHLFPTHGQESIFPPVLIVHFLWDTPLHTTRWLAGSVLTISHALHPLRSCRIALTKAGTYVIGAKVQGCMLPHWPRIIHVSPAQAAASQCTLSGPALQQLVCGQPGRLLLQARDVHGNARSCGGDNVALVARGVGKNSKQVCGVGYTVVCHFPRVRGYLLVG